MKLPFGLQIKSKRQVMAEEMDALICRVNILEKQVSPLLMPYITKLQTHLRLFSISEKIEYEATTYIIITVTTPYLGSYTTPMFLGKVTLMECLNPGLGPYETPKRIEICGEQILKIKKVDS
jgi:hypothetical protein